MLKLSVEIMTDLKSACAHSFCCFHYNSIRQKTLETHISTTLFKIIRGLLLVFSKDGVPVWEEEDSRGDAETESEGAQPSHERAGQRANETGATGEEDHRRHKENGQTGTNGESKRKNGICDDQITSLFCYLLYIILMVTGCCQDHGQRFGSHKALR